MMMRFGTAGSSPLMRGKPAHSVFDAPTVGLIPAHAGKTQSSSAWSGRAWAHPRSRGENLFHDERERRGLGSSPLTRGKLDLAVIGLSEAGLIPTHAGKTRPSTSPRARFKAHPRSCGENAELEAAPILGQGSSPLTRGKPRWRCRGHPVHRLIPAHAGKTCRVPTRLPGSWAHPRSYGENAFRPLRTLVVRGSSPLIRGKRDLALRHRVPEGLIPAHAGKTVAEVRVCPVLGAHPRSCMVDPLSERTDTAE